MMLQISCCFDNNNIAVKPTRRYGVLLLLLNNRVIKYKKNPKTNKPCNILIYFLKQIKVKNIHTQKFDAQINIGFVSGEVLNYF